MNCETVIRNLSLYLYGELRADQDEMVEQHLESCAACARELDHEKALHLALDVAMDRRSNDPSPALLAACRQRLHSALAAEAARSRAGWTGWLRGLMPGPANWILRPAGALALLAIGFAGARLTTMPALLAPGDAPESVVASRVRYLDPDSSGNVRIGLEETRQREITGSLTDDMVRKLLLAAARDPNDAGLRVESVELLQKEGATAEVRQALLQALQSDPNDGVRLKALEALKPFTGQAEVRGALAQALLSDRNPGVRTQAIELLVRENHRDLVGTLQELLRREDNDYIRQRTQGALRALNASVETF